MVEHTPDRPVCPTPSAITEEPVPKVAFTTPGRQPAWANRAACESARTARTGTPSSTGWRLRTAGNGPVEATTVGKQAAGTWKISSRSSDQAPVARSRSWVREALPISVTAPSAVPLSGVVSNRDSSHASIVPTHHSPADVRARDGSYSSRSHPILSAENIGSRGSPVVAKTRSAWPARSSAAAVSAVRWSCQLRTGPMTVPLRRSQRTTVSRWTLRATPATWPTARSSRQARAACCTLRQMSSASCSVQPGWGWRWPTGAVDSRTTTPARSTRVALVELVPWSMASR